MNSNVRIIVGFVIAVIVVIFALTQQQQALNDLRSQMTRAANADAERVTAVAMMQAASGTQVQAEIGQATALAAAQEANAAEATAEAVAGTAVSEVQDAGTRSAQLLATGTAGSVNLLATATMQANEAATLQAEATAEVATLQGQLVGAATNQAYTDGLLGTATAQVDLAEFARKAAEDDRRNALNQLWAISTSVSATQSVFSTAQFILTGVPPTTVPRPTTTPAPQATAAATSGSSTPATNAALPNTFKSTNETVQVNYPDGWFAQEFNNGTIIIVNQESLFTRTEASLTTGQVEVDVLAGTYEQFGLIAGTEPKELLTTIVSNFKSRQSSFQSSEIGDITVGSHNAAQIFANDSNNEISITVVQLSDTALAVAYGIAAKGEGEKSLDTIMSIIATITYIE